MSIYLPPIKLTYDFNQVSFYGIAKHIEKFPCIHFFVSTTNSENDARLVPVASLVDQAGGVISDPIVIALLFRDPRPSAL